MNVIGNAIKRALKAKGKNQTWLARKLKLSDKQISIWCNASEMKTQSMRKILSVLYVPEFVALLGEKKDSVKQILEELEAQVADDPMAEEALRLLAESRSLTNDLQRASLESLLNAYIELSKK